MKKTKWATHKFTAGEKQARAKWRYAEDQVTGVVGGLMVYDRNSSRDDLHKALDKRLDNIERLKKKAKEIFPEVDESFTVATDTIEL